MGWWGPAVGGSIGRGIVVGSRGVRAAQGGGSRGGFGREAGKEAAQRLGSRIGRGGRGGGNNAGEGAKQESAALEASFEGFQMALDMAGNIGQRTIIEQMGEVVFFDAAMGIFAAPGILLDACPHPEAVFEILIEVGEWMGSMVEEGMVSY